MDVNSILLFLSLLCFFSTQTIFVRIYNIQLIATFEQKASSKNCIYYILDLGSQKAEWKTTILLKKVQKVSKKNSQIISLYQLQ